MERSAATDYSFRDMRKWDSQKPNVEPVRNIIDDVKDIYNNTLNMDFDAELINWVNDGATEQDIKEFIQEDTGAALSLAEIQNMLNIMGKSIEQNKTAMTTRVIAYKSSAMSSLTKVATHTYKHKYADVYWKVKAMPDEDGSGKEKYFLVRIED